MACELDKALELKVARDAFILLKTTCSFRLQNNKLF